MPAPPRDAGGTARSGARRAGRAARGRERQTMRERREERGAKSPSAPKRELTGMVRRTTTGRTTVAVRAIGLATGALVTRRAMVVVWFGRLVFGKQRRSLQRAGEKEGGLFWGPRAKAARKERGGGGGAAAAAGGRRRRKKRHDFLHRAWPRVSPPHIEGGGVFGFSRRMAPGGLQFEGGGGRALAIGSSGGNCFFGSATHKRPREKKKRQRARAKTAKRGGTSRSRVKWEETTKAEIRRGGECLVPRGRDAAGEMCSFR